MREETGAARAHASRNTILINPKIRKTFFFFLSPSSLLHARASTANTAVGDSFIFFSILPLVYFFALSLSLHLYLRFFDFFLLEPAASTRTIARSLSPVDGSRAGDVHRDSGAPGLMRARARNANERRALTDDNGKSYNKRA